ncbi:acetolactate synthase small subunit [Halonotius aquaticus]|uniref:Acetolactate synthase small subunit n=1 Tax=Halonotius aquaticus TaxID=2216978 RepID=A0A3A6PT36_9EURY|nr:acetolactate synthase small subunit [Halonotius aquaticus]RJX44825.1 acetolactate synthase small subunit [Halonotius aquaticus]
MSENQQGLQGPPPEERPHPDGRRNSQGIRIDPEVEAEPDSRTAMISALVEHEPGVLARIAGLFSRRQFNIESLTVGPTTVEGNARLTLIVEEPEPGIDQAKKQLAKLKPVISVGELENRPIRSELVLLKVNGDEPDKVQAVTEMYDGTTLDAGPETITVQLTGEYDEIEDALDAYRQFGIIEIARTGPTALARGSTPTTPGEKPAAEATAVGVETDGGSDAGGETGDGSAESQAETTN